MSCFLMAAKRVSSAVVKCEWADGSPCTYARSLYFALMNRSRCSRVEVAIGFCCVAGSNVASHTMLLTRLPTCSRISTMSFENECTSSVNDRILEICVPNDRWMPLHSMHNTIPRLIDTHSTFDGEPQSAHQWLPWSTSRTACSSFAGSSS